MKPRSWVLLAALAVSAPVWSAPGDAQTQRCTEMLRLQLAKPYPGEGCWRQEDFALAAYWLNERTAEADQALLAERAEDFPVSLKEGGFHWHAYLLERIWFLFGSGSHHWPGRMSPAAETALLDMLWQWAEPRCRLEMTLPERDQWVWGSENHHAQAWGSFWGAAQIFARHPAYRARRYADGTSTGQMAAVFDDYFRRYARLRASQGLLVECNSGYNKYTLGGWYNLADFAEDAALRRQMSQLLELFWADWAAEQIDGLRGGSRHRCYPGSDSTEGGSMMGAAWYPFGLGPARSQHPSHMCAATTFWRPSPLVDALAHDVAGHGVHESLSRRPGRAQPGPPANFVADPQHPFYSATGVYRVAADAGVLRYTYGTPDYILGTSMVPALTQADWTNISSQNRWDGVVFAGSRTARIYAQPLQPARGSVYNAYWSVQKRGVLIVQRLKGSNAKGHRLWFDAGLKRAEHDGWVFAEAPQAYAAVRVTRGQTVWQPDSVEQHREGKGATDRGMWLSCGDDFAPAILEVARRGDYADFAAFQAAIVANPLRWTGPRLDYTSALHHTTLSLFADYSQPPAVDGQALDYAPRRVFDSPFIQSDFGSGLVTLRFGGQSETLDFNAP
ncbi:MAG: hypothetical protein HZB16_04055 [Armatimonadetes bacterium]|nr:hypothetical protein [Armatimonadota bacterium]